MRLAEFKTRLFIFFAGRLLKWAESIEQKIDPQQLPPPVDDSKTVVLAEFSRESEAASGPPEHWARLTTSGPPEHWLDLINQKAPHLLSPTGNELLSTEHDEGVSGRESFHTETNQEAKGLPSSEEAPASESQPSFSERKKSRETRDSSARAGSKSWLNRLRFRPPMSSSGSDKSVYVSESRRSGGTASSVAGGAAEKGTAATSRHPRLAALEPQDEISDSRGDGTLALRDRIVRLSRNLSNKAHRSDPFAYHQTKAKSPDSHRARREPQPQQSGPSHSLQRSLTSLEPVNEAEKDTRSNISRERGDSYVTNPRSRTSNESNEGRSVESLAPKPDTKLKKPDRSSVLSFAKHQGESPSLRFVRQPTVQRSSSEPATSFWETQPSRARRAGEVGSNAPEAKTRVSSQSISSAIGSFNPKVNSVTNHQHASNEFASTDRAASKPKTEAPENVWPALPVPPVFELADELAAMEREAEGLRRLEHEQRGNPWNA